MESNDFHKIKHSTCSWLLPMGPTYISQMTWVTSPLLVKNKFKDEQTVADLSGCGNIEKSEYTVKKVHVL